MSKQIATWILTAASLVPAAALAADPPIALPASSVLAPKDTRPEPVIYAIMRRMQLTPVGQGRPALRALLTRFRGLHHDRAIKVGDKWMSGEALKLRRGMFTKVVDELADTLKQSSRYRNDDRAEKIKRARQLAIAHQKLRASTRLWPDLLIRDFLFAQTSLLSGADAIAERRFTACIDRQPLIAGFHQGRAEALEKLDRPLDALVDRMRVFALRPGDGEAYFAIGDTMKKVPGTRITSPVFLKAKSVLALYEPPKRRSSASSSYRGAKWLMPGGFWQGSSGSVPIPACDTFFARKTVAVPVAANGVFLVDATAIAGAAEMLLEIGPDEFLRAEVPRMSSRAMEGMDLPLAVIRVKGRTFTPVAMDVSASVKVKDRLKLYAHSMPAELDSATPRVATVRVAAVGADGVLDLDGPLLPGESTAPVFNHAGKLVTFVAGRTALDVDDGGPGAALKAGDVAKLYAEAVKVSGSRSYASGSYNAPKLKAPGGPVAGQVFTLHILLMQGGPEKKRR